MDDWLLILVFFVISFTTDLLGYFLVIPIFSGKASKRMIAQLLTAETEEDAAIIDKLGWAMADRFAGYVANLGQEYIKGNKQPLQAVIFPIMDTMSDRVQAAVDGAVGNAVKVTRKGMHEEFLRLRESVPKSAQKHLDVAYAIKSLFMPSRESSAKGISTGEYIEV